jgi:tight adherence protein B
MIFYNLFFLECFAQESTFRSMTVELSLDKNNKISKLKPNYKILKIKDTKIQDSIKISNRNLVEVTYNEEENILEFVAKEKGDTTVIVVDEESQNHIYDVIINEQENKEVGLIAQFSNLLGKKWTIGIIFLIIFIYSTKNSQFIFDWVDDQTYGTRNYIMDKSELLFLDLNPEYVKYFLLYLYFGNSLLVISVITILGNPILGGVLGAILSIVGWKVPRPFMDFLIKKRIKTYQSQMVDGLNLMANGLRAGLSLPQSIGMVVDELPNPLSQEFNYVLQQNKIGIPLEECLETLNVRMPTPDNQMFVTSVNVLRETGGNLAETFDTIIDVIKERVRLQQKVDTYVAQGMMQGYILFSTPWLLAAFFLFGNPTTGKLALTTPVGIIMLVAAFGLDFLGLFIILKIVKIEV